jgi:hypothetical protein
VIDLVAAHLFANTPPDKIDAAAYQQILETAAAVCQSLGYGETVKLAPPTVSLAAAGLYWRETPPTTAAPEEETEPDWVVIHAGPTQAEMLADGSLYDARLGRWGLDEISRRHFKIPVTASDAVIALIEKAVASGWPTDHESVWNDILGMCVVSGVDVNPSVRRFAVIIRGVGQRRYYHFVALLQTDGEGRPYLAIHLADESPPPTEGQLFELGRCVMTPGVEALGIDIRPYLARHACGDDGELESFDQRQNRLAVKQGLRILSAYDVPLPNGQTERIWIITESDRSTTTALLPEE